MVPEVILPLFTFMLLHDVISCVERRHTISPRTSAYNRSASAPRDAALYNCSGIMYHTRLHIVGGNGVAQLFGLAQPISLTRVVRVAWGVMQLPNIARSGSAAHVGP
jgi:hypothetical protein